MHRTLNAADVPAVDASDIAFVLSLLIDSGQGLALLRGLNEGEIRELEETIWNAYQGPASSRVAIALRFRALLAVFGSRRLKALFLERGYRVFGALAHWTAAQPLNIRFGVNAQRLLIALDAMTGSTQKEQAATARMRIAA